MRLSPNRKLAGKQKTGPVDGFTYVSGQHEEQPVSSLKSRFNCRYAYGRASETAQLQEQGQDYMAFAVDGRTCSFVLCDGVSMSYRGDFAARYLGEGLLSWLRTEAEPSRHLLQKRLVQLSQAARLEEEALSVDQNAPLLLRDILQEKKQNGSEAMYLCGRIELPGKLKRKGRLWLAWQGDSRLRLFQQQVEVASPFLGTFRTGDRWSTRTGPKGTPNVFECRLQAAGDYRLLLYSDGLSDLDGISEVVPDEHLQVLMDARHTEGLEDDACFLEISW
ncbi:hypothetical protein ACH6EH_14670 [Paenibacillus sp. JSM ZJ436]|uniref:hypothetical protein n=1 Tax=Paenibacillus sp. JSM ZJ436 TaxID=3376190 RepID=UPI0037B6AFA8